MVIVKTFKNIEYGNIHGRPLLLDLHLPAEGNGPFPLVFYVHGGGWHSGNKDDATNLEAFIKAGYAMSAMDYRLSGEAKFPAQIEDVKSALRWLWEHAAELGLDSRRFVAWGHSAGAHLVALLAATEKSGKFETVHQTEKSSGLLGVAAVAAPIDLLLASKGLYNSIGALLGGDPSELAQRAKEAGPLTYLTAEAPPFLIVHGDADQAVPLENSTLLHSALQRLGVPTRLVIQEGVGHGNHNHPGMVKELLRFFDSLVRQSGAESLYP